jgi:hypothetical protein
MGPLTIEWAATDWSTLSGETPGRLFSTVVAVMVAIEVQVAVDKSW